MNSVWQFGRLDYALSTSAERRLWISSIDCCGLMLSWQSRIEPIQKTERHEQHGSLMTEPAIHDGDLAWDADASSCAILPCTWETPSTCQAWEPVQLAPCLGLMLDQLHTRHAESSRSSQTSSMVSMHLLKAYLKQQEHLRKWGSPSMFAVHDFEKVESSLQIKQVRHVERILKIALPLHI